MNATPTEQLRETALRVHAELEEYIALHNQIFANQATAMSTLRRLFGRRIPLEKNYARAAATSQKWCALDAEVHSFVAQTWHSFSRKEQIFAVALREYAKVLAVTVRALEVRQKSLFLKSTGTVLPLNMAAGEQRKRSYCRLFLRRWSCLIVSFVVGG